MTDLEAPDALDVLEQSVIGAVLLRNENLALLPSLDCLHFQGFKARAVWAAIRGLEHEGRAIDVSVIGSELERAGKLDAVGWDYLGGCAMSVPSVDNAIEYAERVRDAALRRRLMVELTELVDAGKRGASGAEMLSRALEISTALDTDRPESASTIGEVVKRRVAQLDQIAKERATGERTLAGFPTGVERLDEKLGGWQPGIVSIIAARPAMGKSSLGLATANACSLAGHGVHLFSLEDTESAYADRALSRESGVPAEKLRNSEISAGDMGDVSRAFRTLGARKRWLFDGRSGISADEIVRSVRRRRKDNATRVVIVDYIQLVKRPARMSPHEAISEIITAFADAAKQDGLAYVVMSQLNRELEKREDKRPQASDLRESGSLEERAKCVVGVYRGSVYGKAKPGVDYDPTGRAPSDEEHERSVQLLLLKNSNGRTGVVRADWFGQTTRIE